jgi:hypothetical protein
VSVGLVHRSGRTSQSIPDASPIRNPTMKRKARRCTAILYITSGRETTGFQREQGTEVLTQRSAMPGDMLCG